MNFGPTAPVLRMFDVDRTRAFYLEFLGFSVEFEHRHAPELPLYMGVTRAGCYLHLTEHHGDCTPGSAVRIQVDDIDALHAELNGKDYGFAKPGIESMPWGTRELYVMDPSGNRLTFTSPVE
ncbi:MAG: glyoxalase superfamily protein [Pseudomonadota bacterium]